jgi:Protein of unknown function (DUF4435)
MVLAFSRQMFVEFTVSQTMEHFLACHELELDLTRRVLIVEGSRDLAFWRELVPSLERGDTVIYPISVIECESAEGGERGRLLCIARAVLTSHSSCRVLFFADADYDRILGRGEPSNVVLTDGRDLESYGLTQACFKRLCVRGIGMDETAAKPVFDHVVEVTRPIGMLRVASTRAQLELPFQRTLERRGLRRFLLGDEFDARVDIEKLISTLLQNANLSLAKKGEVGKLLQRENEALRDIGHDQIVHGKDFTRALACCLDLDEKQIERLLFLSMDFPEIASRPNIAQVQGWVRQASSLIKTA